MGTSRNYFGLSAGVQSRGHEFFWGFTTLAGAARAGKSKLAEFVAQNIARKQQALFLSLKYNDFTIKHRFSHFEEDLNFINVVKVRFLAGI